MSSELMSVLPLIWWSFYSRRWVRMFCNYAFNCSVDLLTRVLWPFP